MSNAAADLRDSGRTLAERLHLLAGLIDSKRAAGGSIRLTAQQALDVFDALYDAGCELDSAAVSPEATP